MWMILIVLAAIFVVWSIITQYRNTLPGQSVWQRVWAAMAAAFFLIVGAIGHWLSSHGTTP